MDAFLLRDYRPDCRYGAGCYQKNPEHKAKFKHPDKDEKKKDESTECDIDKENEATQCTANKAISPVKKRQLSDDSDIEESKKLKLHEISDDSQDEPNTEDEKDSTQETEDEKQEEKVTASMEESFNDILPSSPTNIRDNIKSKFLVSMPEDFYNFYDFCKSLNNSNPIQALNSVGLKLCGPYDVLAGNIPAAAPMSAKLFLTHGRYGLSKTLYFCLKP